MASDRAAIRALAALATAFLITLAVSAPLQAQRSTTRGLMVSPHTGSATIRIDGSERYTHGGGGVRIGYGPTRHLTVLARLSSATVHVRDAGDRSGSWVLGGAGLGLRLNLSDPARRFVPWVEGSWMHRTVRVEGRPRDALIDELDYRGSGPVFGAGLLSFVTPRLAIDTGVHATRGEVAARTLLSPSDPLRAVDLPVLAIDIGVAWWF